MLKTKAQKGRKNTEQVQIKYQEEERLQTISTCNIGGLNGKEKEGEHTKKGDQKPAAHKRKEIQSKSAMLLSIRGKKNNF